MRPGLLLRGGALAGALATAALLSGCRDGVGPFRAPEAEAGSDELRRVTFGIGHDRDPSWNAEGDSILYHSDRWFDDPARGTLLRVAAAGGSARPLAPEAQTHPAVFLSNPVASPAGDRIAYLHFIRVAFPESCPELPPVICRSPEPLLDSAVLRIRARGSVGGASEDPGIGIYYPGADPRRATGGAKPYLHSVHPLQYAYAATDATAPLRPSWAPDGSRLVFSNGVELMLWTPGAAQATPIPNSTDGIAPAWSPDGTLIAFVAVERGPAQTESCLCTPDPSADLGVHQRTWWPFATYRIAVIRPDGTGLRVLAEGQEPAWAPDSKTLYAWRGSSAYEGAIYRIALDAPGTAVAVANTRDGRSPAVSPDGRWLAFTKRKDAVGDFDIWLTRLEN